jgi:UDP-GlcNAc:undecaprenyl-phosphate GlcNAc-1-phosphate transferase
MENLAIKNLLGFLLPLLVSTGLFCYYLFGYRDKSKRWGGTIVGITVIIFITLFQNVFTGFLLPKDYWSLTLGVIILLIGGIWDDLEKINWLKQLFFQSAAALVAVFVGDTINHVRLPGGTVLFFPPLIAAVLAYFWIIMVIEALNWLDGVDGLAGGVSLITVFVLSALGLTAIVNQPSTTLLCLIIAGALLGFLFFNFPFVLRRSGARPARVQLGSAGIWILGFLIAVISIYSGGKVATTALVLGIPIIDFIFVSAERMLAGKWPVFGGDRLHLHERLLDKGWKPVYIVMLFSSFSLLLGIGTLFTQTNGKLYLILPLGVFFMVLAFFYKTPIKLTQGRLWEEKTMPRLRKK